MNWQINQLDVYFQELSLRPGWDFSINWDDFDLCNHTHEHRLLAEEVVLHCLTLEKWSLDVGSKIQDWCSSIRSKALWTQINSAKSRYLYLFQNYANKAKFKLSSVSNSDKHTELCIDKLWFSYSIKEVMKECLYSLYARIFDPHLLAHLFLNISKDLSKSNSFIRELRLFDYVPSYSNAGGLADMKPYMLFDIEDLRFFTFLSSFLAGERPEDLQSYFKAGLARI